MSSEETLSPSQRRVKTLVFLLRRGRATSRELADALRSPIKQVREDLAHLLDVAPIKMTGEGRNREWLVDDGFAVEGLGILDRLALNFGRELTAFLAGTGLGDVARDVRPLDDVPERFRSNLNTKFRLLSEPSRDYGAHRDTIDAVLDGLLRERLLAFRYGATGTGAQMHGVQPLTLVMYRRALYLLAELPSGERRRFALDRMASVETGARFVYPRRFRPEQELEPWFGISTGEGPARVRIRFDASVVHLVRARTWHPSQSLVDREDGGIELWMTTGGRELIRFVLEWGKTAEVLEPPWLRSAVQTELLAALQHYKLEQNAP